MNDAMSARLPAWSRRALACGLLLAASAGALAAAFQDPLDTPPMATARAGSAPLAGVALAGDRLVAVGRRGVVLLSDNAGARWFQASVPLSSDLVAVHFPTAQSGWVVGHDGVILHSSDGGLHWRKQADGRTLARTMLDHYEKRAQTGQAGAEAWVELARRWLADGPIHPFFAVWFKDAREGFAGGAFGLLFHTRDGGQSWETWFDRIDNPKGLHLYGIAGAQGDVLLAGEQGLLAVLEPGAARFRSLKSPYEGSLFGAAARESASGASWLVYGMRGNAYLSDDKAATWRKLNVPTRGGLTAGDFDSEQGLLVTTQTGECLASHDGGETFARVKVAAPMPYFGMVSFGQRRLALVGMSGVRIEARP